jgi:hypothetical protein
MAIGSERVYAEKIADAILEKNVQLSHEILINAVHDAESEERKIKEKLKAS